MKASLFLIIGAFSLPAAAFGDLYSFQGNSDVNLAVTGAGANQVTFTVNNIAMTDYTVTDVYFDDSGMLGYSTMTSSSGTDFAQFAVPDSLPNQDALGFNTTPGLSFDSQPQDQIHNGLDVGQSLSVTFDLRTGGGLIDVINAITSGALKVGIYVQGVHGGQLIGDSYVNLAEGQLPETRIAQAPLPGAWLLGALGLGICGFCRRKFGWFQAN